MKIIWNFKTSLIIAISLFLFMMGICMFFINYADKSQIPLLFFGSIVGLFVFLNGGAIPRMFVTAIRIVTFGTPVFWDLKADDDPRNLPVKIYLPILIVVILLTAIAIFYAGRK